MTTLTFHHPSAFFWALLAVPLVVFYLRRVEPAARPIGTGFLWQQVLGRPATARWLLWRGPVSLGLLLLVLLLLVLALADPSLRPARRTVLVIDNSASMNATDAAPTRLDQARQWADRWVGDLAAHEEAAILTTGDGVGACCGWSRRPAILRQAIQRIAATDGRAEVRQAVAMAQELLAGDPHGRILVLSDGAFPGAAELAQSGGVRWVSFGGRGDNVGITRFVARRNLSDPPCCQVFVEVTSYCDQPVACPLQLSWDDAPLERRSIEIPAGGRWRQIFQTTRAEGGRLTAHIDHPDCYLADNRATAIVAPCSRFQVFLDGDKNLYLEKALAANPRVLFGRGARATADSSVTRKLPSPFGRGAGGEGNPPQLPHHGDLPSPKSPCPDPLPEAEGAANRAFPDGASAAVVRVIYGPVPKTLPAGPLVVLRPEGPCDLWLPGEAIAEPVVARQAEDLPLLKEVRLAGIRLAEARKLLLRPKAEPLAQPLAWAADGSPLGYAIPRPEGRVLVLAGSLEGGEWPQRTAFPILLANALDWVAGRERPPLPSGEGWGEGMFAGTGSAENQVLSQFPLTLALSRRERGPSPFASDIRVPQGLAGKTVASEDREFPLWICLVGLAGLLLTAEWCLYHRRWTC